jgi:prophage DNA circulation protein
MSLFGFLEDIVKGDDAKRKSENMAKVDNARRNELKNGKADLEKSILRYDRNSVNPHSDKSLGSASFNGIQFFVDSIETEFGRRVAVHQFPFQDQPYSEDVGRLPRTFVVNAHVVDVVGYKVEDVTEKGSRDIFSKTKKVGQIVTVGKTTQYEKQRNKLINELENVGIGKFIHPTMGEYVVVPLSCSVVFDNKVGNYETFRITFKEAGVRENPTSKVDTKGEVYTAREAIKTISTENFIESYEKKLSKPDWIDALLSGDINSLFDKIREEVGLGEKDTEGYGDFFDTLNKAQSAVGTLLSLPATLATTYSKILSEVNNAYTNPFTKLKSAFSLFNFNTSELINSDSAFLIGGGVQKPMVDPGTGEIVLVDVVRTDNEIIAQDLRKLMEDLQKQILLVNLADLVITTTYESSSQAIFYKDKINDAFDEMILNMGDSTETGANDAYLALLDLKSKVNSDMIARVESLPDVRQVEILSIKPVLVVAYNEYDDSTRYEEIAIRNDIVQNLRIPIGEIEVIS